MTMTSKSPLPKRSTPSTSLSTAHDDRLSSLLASSAFSISDYLNLALSPDDNDNDITNANTTTEDVQLEQRMASLALQLQITTQSCHDEIGRIGAELQAIVPRCAADVTRVESGLEGMELDVRGLLDGLIVGGDDTNNGGGLSAIHGPDVSGGGSSNDIDPINNTTVATTTFNNNNNQEDNTNPLSTLHSLLNLKNHLTTTRSILAAASSWDETINSIPKLLSNTTTSSNNNTTTPNLIEAVSALTKLESGARALQFMPEGQDERSSAISKLRSQLEVLLKPQLLHALKKMDTRLGPLQQCVGMYASLNKLDVMREEYVKLRPGEVISLWFRFGSSNIVGQGVEEEKVEENKESDVDEEEEAEDFDFSEEHEDTTTTTPTTTNTHTSTTSINAKQFIQFLPTFYEAVLELLAKERTQSKQVFGDELAPSIVARVLLECFTPIISSFQSRLGQVCPLPGTTTTASASGGGKEDGFGGTEGIAAAYESTIQFLSLAYDQMEPWESTTTSSTTPTSTTEGEDQNANNTTTVMETIRTAFKLIASPFAPYQMELAEVERDPLGKAASMVAKDVRGVVGLEDAADRLGDLAPFMFPLADSTISRFEILTSGYNAPTTLSLVDNLIATHASELAIVMGSLSSHVSNNTGNELDEQHANCALEILRIAGSFKRTLQSFDDSVKDRLRNLSDTMMDDALEEGSGMIPSALEPSQLRSFLAKEACISTFDYIDDGTGVKLPASVVELRRLAGTKSTDNGTTAPPLFPKSLDAASRLARSCQSFVFEVCYAIPEQQLRGISALPIWKQDGAGDGEEESYGILPQSFITHVGEHILALVQALEPFASDTEALGLANEVMTGVIEVAVQPWKEFVAAAGVSLNGDEKSQLTTLMRGKEVTQFFDADEDFDTEHQMEDDDEEEDADDLASTAFCNHWLDVVGLAVAGRLLERTMRIPRLGRKGAEHLAADLNYIRNVFTALGVAGHPHPLLGYVAKLVTMDEESLQFKIQSRQGEKITSATLEVIKRAEIRIAYVRGISV